MFLIKLYGNTCHGMVHVEGGCWHTHRSVNVECQGRSNLRPRGVDAQRLCPLKCQGKMSSK